jgi:GTP-binding protein
MSSLPVIPLVAIVGRPNVGKSRLFNRLTRSQKAIVEDTPGVTRDRNYGEAEYEGKVFNVVDTGGFEPDSVDELLSKMREQAQLAIDEADLVLLVFDVQQGVMPADADIVAMLRKSHKRCVYAVNKVDGGKQEALMADFFELGLDRLHAISAEHGRGMDELLEDLTTGFPRLPEETEDSQAEAGADVGPVRVAIVGRPNVGKSTLVNRLIGEERMLTSEMPGTTRDAIDSVIQRAGQEFVLIDTAGIRRRRGIHLAVEQYSVMAALRAMDRAEVVVFLLDPGEGPTDQDARLLSLIEEKGRGLVLVMNKWDAVEKDTHTMIDSTKAIRETLPFCTYAPIEFISARTGQRVDRVLEAVLRARASWRRRVGTSELNVFLAQAVAAQQPPIQGNKRARLYYMTQVAVRPPRFAIMCSNPHAVPTHYRRYLANRMRDAYGFEGTPIRLRFRARTRHDDPHGGEGQS